ncbi:MAG: hypothetical protein Q8P12_05170 [bacterium]|nr:hypothetical protein [bacterium]
MRGVGFDILLFFFHFFFFPLFNSPSMFTPLSTLGKAGKAITSLFLSLTLLFSGHVSLLFQIAPALATTFPNATVMEPLWSHNVMLNSLPLSTQKRTGAVSFALPNFMMVSAVPYVNGVGFQYAPMFLDVNADGKVDMVYSDSQNGWVNQFVALGTGQGWEVVYKCRSNIYVTPVQYRGDCAQ